MKGKNERKRNKRIIKLKINKLPNRRYMKIMNNLKKNKMGQYKKDGRKGNDEER